MCPVRSVTYVSGRLASPDSAGCARALTAEHRGRLSHTLVVFAWHLAGAFRIYGRRWTRTLVGNRQLASSGFAPYILTENDKRRVKSSVIIFYSGGLLRHSICKIATVDCHIMKPCHGAACVW